MGKVPHDQVVAFASSADLFVLGSAHEAAGYALIEACACGVIPVVTDIAPFRAITADGAIGALWAVGDAAACASALVEAAGRDLDAEQARVLAHFDRHLSLSEINRAATGLDAKDDGR